MYYARTNKPGTQDSLALVLSLLWQVMSCLMCLCSHNKLRSHLKKKKKKKKKKRSCCLFMIIAYLFEASLIPRSRAMKNKPRRRMSSVFGFFFGDFWNYLVYLFIHSLKYLNLKAKFEQEKQQIQNNEVLKAERTRDTAIVNTDWVNFSRTTTPSQLKFMTASTSRAWNCSSLESSGQ